MIEQSKPKVGRNDACPCGSGKKSKFCCEGDNGEILKVPTEEVKVPAKKMLNQGGFNRCFLKVVKDAGGFLDVSCADLEALPKDEALAIKHLIEGDVFHFEVVKVKKSPIIQTDKRLRLPGFQGS